MMIAERVDRVLRRQLGEGFDWNPDTSLTETDGLALDSLDLVELVVGLETEFAIEIADDELTRLDGATATGLTLRPQFDRIRDIADFITRRLDASPAMFG